MYMCSVVYKPQTSTIMSGDDDFDETEYNRAGSSADTNVVDLRMNFEHELGQVNGLTRDKLEELTVRILCKVIDQHMNAAELVRKLNETNEQLASLQQKYNDLNTQINQIAHYGDNVLQALDSTPNPNTLKCYRIRRSVGVQVKRHAAVKRVDQSTLTTAGAVPVSISEPVAKEDTALVGEPSAKIPSSPRVSHKSVVHPAPLPQLPVVDVPESPGKPLAPAPQIRVHVLDDQVALTWSKVVVEDLSVYEPMLSYQVYCYRQTSDPPCTDTWRRILDLPARPLPMTCVVSRCSAGQYYFAVRGIDGQMRVGPFSSVQSIIFNDAYGLTPVGDA